MIKAEVINHEGNPGPNWLDRCRNAITPTSVSVLVMVIAGGVLFVGLNQKDQPETATQLPTTSQQPAQSKSSTLKVEPVTEKTPTATGDNPNLQSAPSTDAPATTSPVQDKSADALGPARAPAIHSANPQDTQQSQYQNPLRSNLLNTKQITNQLQSTVKDINNRVNQTVNGLTSGLGL